MTTRPLPPPQRPSYEPRKTKSENETKTQTRNKMQQYEVKANGFVMQIRDSFHNGGSAPRELKPDEITVLEELACKVNKEDALKFLWGYYNVLLGFCLSPLKLPASSNIKWYLESHEGIDIGEEDIPSRFVEWLVEEDGSPFRPCDHIGKSADKVTKSREIYHWHEKRLRKMSGVLPACKAKRVVLDEDGRAKQTLQKGIIIAVPVNRMGYHILRTNATISPGDFVSNPNPTGGGMDVRCGHLITDLGYYWY